MCLPPPLAQTKEKLFDPFDLTIPCWLLPSRANAVSSSPTRFPQFEPLIKRQITIMIALANKHQHLITIEGRNDGEVPAKLITVENLQLGHPFIENDFDHAVTSLDSSALIYLIAIRKYSERDTKVFQERLEELQRLDDMIQSWATRRKSTKNLRRLKIMYMDGT